MCSLMMISDMLSKHVGAVKNVLKKLFKINDIQLVHLLVMCYLVNQEHSLWHTVQLSVACLHVYVSAYFAFCIYKRVNPPLPAYTYVLSIITKFWDRYSFKVALTFTAQYKVLILSYP